MTKRLLLFVLLGVFVLSCKTKHTVTYGKERSTTEVETQPRVTPENKLKGGRYELPEDNGKFMTYEINSVDAYIDFFSEIAQLEMKTYGIPASITLAQGLLESGLGKGALAMKTNNHFGIKCHTGWAGDYVLHDDDEKDECFRKYNHPMYSYRDHSIFLSGRSRYASLFDLDKDDYKGWAKGLQKAGYATDKRYPQKLISLIERYELHQYDDVAVAVSKKKDEAVADKDEVVTDKDEAATDKDEAVTDTEDISWVPKNTPKPVSTVTHTVVRGDSLWSLSRAYGVSIKELRQWNNLSGNNLSIGQQLIVKKN